MNLSEEELKAMANEMAQPKWAGILADKDLPQNLEPRMVAAVESCAVSLAALVTLLSPPAKAQAAAEAAQGLKPRMVAPAESPEPKMTGLIWPEPPSKDVTRPADAAPTVPRRGDWDDMEDEEEEVLDQYGNLVYRKVKGGGF